MLLASNFVVTEDGLKSPYGIGPNEKVDCQIPNIRLHLSYRFLDQSWLDRLGVICALAVSRRAQMLQALINLDDDQMEAILSAVLDWCKTRGVNIESDEGQRAVSIAVDILCSRKLVNFRFDLDQQLAKTLH